MTFFNGSGAPYSDHKEVFNKVIDMAVAEGWTEVYPREDYIPPVTGNTERRVILESVGLDADHKIYIAVQTESNPIGAQYGLMASILFSYDSGKDYDDQEHRGGGDIWPCIPLGTSNMKLYVSATGTRINIVVHIDDIAFPLSFGTPLTNVGIDEYAYPALIGGVYINNGNFTVATSNSVLGGIAYNSGSNLLKCFLINETSCAAIAHTDNLPYTMGETALNQTYPYPASFFSNKRTGIGEVWTVYPITSFVLEFDLGITITLDGFFRIGGFSPISNGDTIVAGGITYHAFRHPLTSGVDSWYVMEAI
ncbi:MAG: hypothetical protein COB09_18500 [Thalassobium sp.]|nr:MAG: hypothetical protein COB09_18500 [Thalassobium sp.]